MYFGNFKVEKVEKLKDGQISGIFIKRWTSTALEKNLTNSRNYEKISKKYQLMKNI